jgi:hypothetical protein
MFPSHTNLQLADAVRDTAAEIVAGELDPRDVAVLG